MGEERGGGVMFFEKFFQVFPHFQYFSRRSRVFFFSGGEEGGREGGGSGEGVLREGCTAPRFGGA